jgi:hypothetical protein
MLMQFAQPDDGRGKYPEPLKIQAELGTRAKVRQAAEAEGVSIGEFVRRAIGERMARAGAGKSSDAAARVVARKSNGRSEPISESGEGKAAASPH